jgi:hypothetical protein
MGRVHPAELRERAIALVESGLDPPCDCRTSVRACEIR